jgi:nucleoid-associated protein YgaU
MRAAVATALVATLVALTGRAALGGANGHAAASAGEGFASEAQVVVRPGDTLWEIARAVVGPEGDPRPVVERIRDANRLGPSQGLLPGMSLIVPAS